MILTKHVNAVRILVQTAAVDNKTVSFPQLFRLFPEKVPPHDVYDTLEAACAELADWKTAIYSVVMAKSATGLPGDGFFDIFRNHREDAYLQIAGDTHVHGLSQGQRLEMVQFERPLVRAHAKP